MKTIDLKLLRKSKKLTQDDLANLLGYSTNGFISQIETGSKKIPRNLELKLNELFGDLSSFYKDIPNDVKNARQDMVMLPKSILDDISKLAETIRSQQRVIERLVEQNTNKK